MESKKTLPKKLAFEIESELMKSNGGITNNFKTKFRSLVHNIKDDKNVQLREKIVDGRISVEGLCQMGPRELANEQIAEIRNKEEKEYSNEKVKKVIEQQTDLAWNAQLEERGHFKNIKPIKLEKIYQPVVSQTPTDNKTTENILNKEINISPSFKKMESSFVKEEKEDLQANDNEKDKDSDNEMLEIEIVDLPTFTQFANQFPVSKTPPGSPSQTISPEEEEFLKKTINKQQHQHQ